MENKDEELERLRVENAKLKRKVTQLRKKLYYDPLTEIYTKNWMLQKYKNIDIDNYIVFLDGNKLKNINDKLGHKAGDNFLIKIANYLKSLNGDAIRYAGDEFLFLTKDKTAYEQLINSKNPDFSCGGVIPGEYKTFAEGINIADEKMYFEKRKHYESLKNNDGHYQD